MAIVAIVVISFLLSALQVVAQSLPQLRSPDMFDQLVASGASFDMDSPVVASAEFDPPTVSAGGHVTYRVEVTALDESLTMPDALPLPKGLELHAGGRGQTYQQTPNLKLRPHTTVIFRAKVTDAGAFTIPSYELLAYGKPVPVPAATLTVLPAGEGVGADATHLEVILPKGNLYVGQMLKIVLAIPNTGTGDVLGLSQPHITGDYIFAESSHSMMIRQEAVMRNGRVMNMLINEVSITPLRAGKQELIGQASTVVLSSDPGQPGIRRTSNRLVDSDPVVLEVKPLPAKGVPGSFTGAVGNFNVMAVNVYPTNLHAGEPVTIIAQIAGDGNLGRLIPAALPAMNDWQTFPPVAGDAVSVAQGNTPRVNSIAMEVMAAQQRGLAVFRYTVIPMSDRLIATPGIAFGYFDPVTENYKELVIPPVAIKVLPGKVTEGAKFVLPGPTNQVPDEGTNDEPKLILSGLASSANAMPVATLVPLQKRGGFWLAQLLPALAIGGFWCWCARREHLKRHPEIIRKRQARRGLRRELKLAKRAATARDASTFATRAANALREASAPHTAANPGALVCTDVLLAVGAQCPASQSDDVIRRLFTVADASRFGGRIADAEADSILGLQPHFEKILEEMRPHLC